MGASRALSGWRTLPVVLAATAAGPALAQDVAINLPGGSLGDAAAALARQTGTSIVIASPALYDRPVAAVRGRMPVARSVRRLARQAGAEAIAAGATAFRLVPTKRRRRPVRSAPPPAPRSAEEPLGDVIVTASKRGIAAADMAGSVEILDPPPVGIEAGTAALVARSTIISTTHRGSGREKLFVRGLADSSFAGRLQSVTGLYLGEVRLSYSAADPDLQLYDVASVEVLQGPQGTLYGAGALAGIIRTNPVMPRRGVAAASIRGGATAVAHGGLGGDADAVINLPLGEAAAVRAVAYGRSEAGYIDKPALGRDVNRTRIAGGRAIARWWIGDGWTADAIGIVQTTRSDDTQYATRRAPPLTSLTPIAEPSGGDYRAGHVVVDGRIGDLVAVSTTGYAVQSFDERFGGATTGTIQARRRHDLVTHESRLSRSGDGDAGWVIGISFARRWSEAVLRSPAGSGVQLRGSDATTSELALFGEGSVRIAPFLSLGAGARLVGVDTQDGETFIRGDADRGSATDRVRERWIVPTASVLVRPLRDTTFYLRYQEGRRPALARTLGLQRLLGGAGERIRTVTAGVRWLPARGPTLSASVQRSGWRGIQADLLESFIFPFSGSIGDATITSANVVVEWSLAPGLTLDAAATVNRSTIIAAAEPLRTRLPDVADLIGRAGVRWSRPLSGDTTLNLDGWLRYEGASFATIGPTSVGTQGRYLRSGLTVGVGRGAATMTLGIDNLFDVRGDRSSLPSLLVDREPLTPLRPRTVRIGLRREF